MSTRLKRALSDAESGRPLRSITQADEEYEAPQTDESDSDQPPAADEEALLSDSMASISRNTRSRSRSLKPDIRPAHARKLGASEHSVSPVRHASLSPPSAAIPSAMPLSASRATPPRHPRTVGSNKKKAHHDSATTPATGSVATPSRRGSTKKESSGGSGSNKKKELASVRKGSDARREQTAAEIRVESERLERLFFETAAAKRQAEEERLARVRAAKQASMRWVWIPLVLAVVLLGGSFVGLMISSHFASIGGLLAPPEPFARSLQAFQNSAATTSLLRADSLQRLTSALQAHEDGYQMSLAEARAGGEDATTGVGLLQPTKPLVLLMVTSSGASADGTTGDVAARGLVQQLASRLAGSPASSVLDFTGECRRQMGADANSWSAQQAREILKSFFQQSSSSSSSRPSLSHGVVWVSHSESLPRSVAEVFHRFVDDVQAPVTSAIYAFQVDAGAPLLSIEAADAAAATLEQRWTRPAAAQQGPDEVLQPLLSRVIRNVIDMRVRQA